MQQKSRVKESVRIGVQEKSEVGTEVSKVSITMVSIFAAVVGLWSFACIVGGLIASGGPLSFVKSWFGAVSGM
jgi:hypothetical protein